MIKKLKWNSTRPDEEKQIYLYVGFNLEGPKKNYEFLVEHYHHLAEAYRLEMLMFHEWESDSQDSVGYVHVHLRKKVESVVLNPKALLMLFENDAKLLQRIYRLPEVIIGNDPYEIREFVLKENLSDWY